MCRIKWKLLISEMFPPKIALNAYSQRGGECHRFCNALFEHLQNCIYMEFIYTRIVNKGRRVETGRFLYGLWCGFQWTTKHTHTMQNTTKFQFESNYYSLYALNSTLTYKSDMGWLSYSFIFRSAQWETQKFLK